MKMTTMMPSPTVEQLEALRLYAIAHGRNWKSALRHDWETGRSSSLLQQVRNQFGPSWLVHYRAIKLSRKS